MAITFNTTISPRWDTTGVSSLTDTVPAYYKDYQKDIYGNFGIFDGIKIIKSDAVPPGQIYTQNDPMTWEEVTYMHPRDFNKLYQIDPIPYQTPPPPPSVQWYPPSMNHADEVVRQQYLIDQQKYLMDEKLNKLIHSKYFDPYETKPAELKSYPKAPELKPIEDPDPQLSLF